MREAMERRNAAIAELGYEEYIRIREEEKAKQVAADDAERDKRLQQERVITALDKSGLKGCLNEFRFDNFKREQEFQQRMFNTCERFLAQKDKRFLYISGQPGCGKTHLGTAVCGAFINRGAQTRYVIYDSMMDELKANVNDEDYEQVLKSYGMVRVLYIDDFMKPVKENGSVKPPTASDVKHTFKVINMRVVNGLFTIITSERSVGEIIQIDEALGSRIKQMSGEFAIDIARKEGRNYRLKG